MIDRFSRIEPTALLAVDGYRYGSRDIDKRGFHRPPKPPRGWRIVMLVAGLDLARSEGFEPPTF